MKATELRIGNWVKFMDCTEELFDGQVTDLHPFQAHCDNWAVKEPIPLTEEWLVRMGAKINVGLMGQTKTVNIIDGLHIPEWIEFVHEAQNWYYWTFKKEELEIKEG